MCDLTPEEQADRARRNADAVQELRSIEGEKKASAADFKGRIDEKKAEIYELADAATTGKEYRHVEVREHINRELAVCEIIRIDTGAVIDTRPLSFKEQQMSLDSMYE